MKLWGRSGIALMTESLARLTPGTQDWDGMPPGGVPALTGAEMAGALAGLPRPQYLLGRLAYVGDETVLDELKQVVLVRASDIFRKEDVYRPGFIREMCEAAIWDVCKPPRCPVCKGTKDAPTATGVRRTCDLCHGLGLVHMGSKRACATFRIGRERWGRVKYRYHNLESLLWAWDGTVVGHVRRQLRIPTACIA